MARTRVVIVGAGFGGLAAAESLRHADVDVTIVDRNNFHTFQPLLYQVATSGLNAADVASPIRGLLHRHPNAEFRKGTVTGVDWDTHVLRIDGDGHGHDVGDLPFDRLIVAAGATTNTFGIDGVAEHGFPLYTLADAVRLRNHVLERFEAVDADPSLIDDGALTFVVVGGGPTGVEVAGALAELFSMVLRKDFKHIDIAQARVVLVEMLDHLLTPFSPSSRAYARSALEDRGVEVRTGTHVEAVEGTKVRLGGGELLKTHTLLWAAGVKANPLVGVLGVPTGRGGRIKVGPDLRIVDHPEAYAIGDVAAIADPAHGDDAVLPQLAPVAIQSGHHVAKQIIRTAAGQPTESFHYLDKGTMATIGRSRAVAELPLGIKLRGTPAWFAWLGLHLVFLAGFRNRISV
ncbi:MAG TPA: NAD(P)/FAD-dependent oxidoreductase, partial [Acidimicrobiales bacterium]